MAQTGREKPALVYVQYLRALAALMVVFHHLREPRDWVFSPLEGYDFGATGVDIFFVISGFIMYTAARDEPVLDFAWRRTVRIAPLYWAATLATFALHAAVDQSSPQFTTETAAHIVKSLLFIPHFSPSDPEFIWPYLVPGWTLNYEMFFYAIFAVAIACKRPVVVTAALICGFILLGFIAHPTSAIGRVYTNPVMVEFLIGILIGVAFRRTSLKHFGFLLPAGILALFLSDFVATGFDLPYQAAAASAILVGALALESRKARLDWKWLKLLGDASYSIYLSHVGALMLLFPLWHQIPLTGWPQFIGILVSGFVVAAVGGVAIHLLIERPMLRILRRLGPQSRRVPAAA